MDKSTLSNYGWVVIAVLVLSVMIALATPFGDYIGNAVKSTTEGLFDVQRNALDAAGMIINDQDFEDGDNGILYGDVNMDGKVTDEDVDLVASYIANFDHETNTSSIVLTEEQFKRADVDFNGVIDAMDIIGISKNIPYYGDVDMDGDIDMDDKNLLGEYLANFDPDTNTSTISLTAEQIERADVNGDGSVTAKDVSIIKNYVNGNIDSFPVEE